MDYMLCNTVETAARQRHIENCLLDTLSMQIYSNIRIGEICKLAGVSRRLFYRYFGSKDGALNAIIDHALTDFTIYLSANGEKATDMSQVFRYWRTKAKLLDALKLSGLQAKFLERCLIYAYNDDFVLRECLALNGTCDQETIVFAINGIASMILKWHEDGFPTDPEEMAQKLRRVLFFPLLTPIAK